jgi:hypothetical protein
MDAKKEDHWSLQSCADHYIRHLDCCISTGTGFHTSHFFTTVQAELTKAGFGQGYRKPWKLGEPTVASTPSVDSPSSP